jgi:hypothetical protein
MNDMKDLSMEAPTEPDQSEIDAAEKLQSDR